jgi:hypothetical protein
MAQILGLTLTAVAVGSLLFLAAVFHAAAVEVRRKPRFTLLSSEAQPPSEEPSKPGLARAA